MSWKATAFVRPITHDPSGRRLTASEKLVLMILADYYNDHAGYAWPSVPSLATDTLLSERQCIRVLESLEQRKIIKSEQRKGETNLYSFTGIISEEACWYCGTELFQHNRTQDHQIPLSRGGRGGRNLVLACDACNRAKSTHTVEEYRLACFGAEHRFFGEGSGQQASQNLSPDRGTRPANLSPSKGTGPDIEQREGVTSRTENAPSMSPEPIIEPPVEPPGTDEPAKLALPKPERRKSKTQRARERFFARRGAEAHPDEGRKPDTRKAPTAVEDAAAPHPTEDRTAASPKVIQELYKEARRIFKSRTGHVLGTLGQKSGEQWVEAYEKHGGDVLIRAFEVWVEAEKRFVGKMDYPIARFLKAVDEWAQDATTPVAPDDDPNAGLALTDQGRRMYEKYAGKAP